MKDKRIAIILLLLIISLTSLLHTFASEPVNLEGINVSGRFLVPMRAIFENLGATVDWDGATRTVTGIKDAIEVKLTIDDVNAYINDELIVLDVPATIEEGRTYVPARFVGEALGADVGWDGTKRMATVALGDTVISIYEELPPEPEVIITESISHTVFPRVVRNGGNQRISLEATITDDEGMPVEGSYVEFFISSGQQDRNNQVVYESQVTDENGRIRASYTTSAMDNDRSFIVRIGAIVDDENVEAASNFIVTNQPTARVHGVVSYPTTGEPVSNISVGWALRDSNAHRYLSYTDFNGRYDAYVPISNGTAYIGIDFRENLLDVTGLHRSSQSYIDPSINRFSLEVMADINRADTNYEVNFDHGIVKGRTRNNAQVYVMKYVDGVRDDQRGILFDALPDGNFVLPLQPGRYDFTHMGGAYLARNVIISKGEILDLGTIDR